LVLVDPAYEDAGDFARLGQGLVAAHRKWASGIFLGWYPIKERTAPHALARRLRNSGIPKILRAELSIAAPREPSGLAACGLILINPPWTLTGELAMLLPQLALALRERRWRPPSRLARRRKVGSPLFHSPGLAYFDRVGFDVPPPVGAGGVTEAVRPLLSPFVNVRPSRRAVGSAAEQPRGEEFPDGHGRYGQVLQCRARLRFHQTG
jgi:hypothetical protein